MRTVKELRKRIQAVYDADERLNQRDYFGLLWVAAYAADAAVIADALLEILDGQPVPTL